MTPCKIIDASAMIEPLAWHHFGVPGSASLPAAAKSGAGVPAPPQNEPDESVWAQRLAQLEAKHVTGLEQARRSAFEQGLKQARHEAAAEMEGALDRLARTIKDVAEVKQKVRNDAEHELVKLALAIAHRILHREVTTDPQSLLGVVHAALQKLKNREVTRIRVFPAAVPAVRAALERNGGLAAIEIFSDAMLPAGGLIFETSLGELDASVDTQLQEIERGFTDRLQIGS